MQSAQYKPVDKVVRVDSYESRAAFISTVSPSQGSVHPIHKPGVKFVTVFCDEQKV